jgi:hypothetical protein
MRAKHHVANMDRMWENSIVFYFIESDLWNRSDTFAQLRIYLYYPQFPLRQIECSDDGHPRGGVRTGRTSDSRQCYLLILFLGR